MLMVILKDSLDILGIFVYDERIVPMLQRMFNLDKLALTLVIDRQERFLDGNDLQNNIVRQMPRLKEFQGGNN